MDNQATSDEVNLPPVKDAAWGFWEEHKTEILTVAVVVLAYKNSRYKTQLRKMSRQVRTLKSQIDWLEELWTLSTCSTGTRT